MSLATYQEAYDAFVPAEDDNPDCVPFYRAAAGLRAVWGGEFCDKYHWAFHEAFCAAGDGGYEAGAERLRKLADAAQNTLARSKKPVGPCFYEQEPPAPTEAGVRRFFNEEYKKAFPRRRANSKHANEQWEKKRDAAWKICNEIHEAQVEAYCKRKQAAEDEKRRIEEKWQREVANYEEFLADVERVLS